MNPYYVPDRPIPDYVDNYEIKPRICPECGCEINETVYICGGMVIGCENCIREYSPDDDNVDKYFD